MPLEAAASCDALRFPTRWIRDLLGGPLETMHPAWLSLGRQDNLATFPMI